jgi:DNA-directed RNA polymerase specialized sigma24 family protein
VLKIALQRGEVDLEKMPKNKKITYEEKIDVINSEIKKRKNKWFLDSIPWISFEDVEQIIRVHIYQKWDQWDQKRELKPWINKIITNQFKNILRNYYLNFAKPCSSCPFDTSVAGENFCSFTKSGMQDSTCPLYKKWTKSKKSAHDVKIPLRLDAQEYESNAFKGESFQVDKAVEQIDHYLREQLSSKHYEIYNMLFIENMSEDEVAKKLGYKTTEKGRSAGYKQIKNMRKFFKEKVLKIIKDKDIIT